MRTVRVNVDVDVELSDVLASLSDHEMLEAVTVRGLLRPANQLSSLDAVDALDLIEGALRGRGDAAYALVLVDRLRKAWVQRVLATTNTRGLLAHPHDHTPPPPPRPPHWAAS